MSDISSGSICYRREQMKEKIGVIYNQYENMNVEDEQVKDFGLNILLKQMNQPGKFPMAFLG